MASPKQVAYLTQRHFINVIVGNSPCFGKRVLVNGTAGPFVWQSYNEIAARINNIGYVLVF